MQLQWFLWIDSERTNSPRDMARPVAVVAQSMTIGIVLQAIALITWRRLAGGSAAPCGDYMTVL